MAELTLRQYQTDLVSDVNAAFQSFNSVMMVLPTGAGKTITAATIAKGFNKVMWAAHRIELLQQADEKLKGNHDNYKLQSVWAQPPDEYFDLLVLDETHHAPAPTLQEFIARSKCGKILGLTATPFRLDHRFIGFEKVIDGASFDKLVEAGFLVPIDLYSLRGQNRYDLIIDWLIENPDKARGSIVFTPNVADSQGFVDVLGFAYATAAIHGEQPAAQRADIIKSYLDGKTDILVSCMILTEGTDLPRTQTICLARQTDSVGLLMQMVGRGVRPHDGKNVCNVVEAVTPNDRHKSIVGVISPGHHYIIADGRKEEMVNG